MQLAFHHGLLGRGRIDQMHEPVIASAGNVTVLAGR
jgi:hypothetical protein